MSQTCQRCYRVVHRACQSDAESADCINLHRNAAEALPRPSPPIRHGTYAGPVEALRGKTALIRPAQMVSLVLIQADDTELWHEGERLGFGWHLFPSDQWTIDPAPVSS